ncbi:hypothetical protein BCR44DRAFT_1084786 [Catenaria anguillulae PL171]|uniref:c-Myc-binding protein n=1 Tax=Catenaria anguillulae PL171 TaxID=765915 RepID=A0A1Y2HNU7_9FUNG|nr:hypothetical protein BCR44DRAFT_1084786 [Catenaria anguillulae PL171]
MSYQVSDTKKEDFRKYLERYGIVDALTKVLVGLYEQPDKPENPLEFIKHYLSGLNDLDAESLKAENSDLRKQVDELASRVDELTRCLVANNVAVPPRIVPTASAASAGAAGPGGASGATGAPGEGLDAQGDVGRATADGGVAVGAGEAAA